MPEYSLGDRLKHAWNAFTSRSPTTNMWTSTGYSYGFRPDRLRLTKGHERSIINSIYTKIAIDVSQVNIKHVRLDKNDRYIETIDSGLNNVLSVEANIDQSGREFIRDTVITLCDEGCVALIPVDTTLDPNVTGSYDILTIRTAKILQWYPQHIRVSIYNEKTGKHEEMVVPKKIAAIVENPLYSVMNEPNSILQRLARKMNLLDSIDEKNNSGKLDLIIQLPYVIKSQSRKEQAEARRKEIEMQLIGSKYGIAYTDGTEKITQLNRPVENNLMSQIEYLTNLLYSQLGITKEVFEGTADEKTMLNYYNRTIEPFLTAITDAMHRKFLTKTSRSQGQAIRFFRDPFKLVPIDNIAEIADKFTRNEIMTSNEIRQVIGMKPSDDPKADQLVNSNLNQAQGGPEQGAEMEDAEMSEDEFAEIMSKPIDELM